jgi:hypothetical protein
MADKDVQGRGCLPSVAAAGPYLSLIVRMRHPSRGDLKNGHPAHVFTLEDRRKRPQSRMRSGTRSAVKAADANGPGEARAMSMTAESSATHDDAPEARSPCRPFLRVPGQTEADGRAHWRAEASRALRSRPRIARCGGRLCPLAIS